jgi:hypothetical protein
LTAREAVDRLNAEGAGLQLGEPLASSPGVETRALMLEEAAGDEDDGHVEEGGHEHAGGSIAAYPDGATAERELANCRRSAAASGALFCIRVDNVLVIFGGDIAPAEVAPVLRAARAIEG